MEIYIIRDGKQIGPFSKETTSRLLTQGSVLPRDLAWQAGMIQWLPLEAVLVPASDHNGGVSAGADATFTVHVRPPLPGASLAIPPAPPISAGSPSKEASPAGPGLEPATARQKAFLKYIGIEFPPELTHSQAILLVNETMENPKDASRLGRWNEERLRLHPDLYAAELLAKKEGRPNRFFEMAEKEGSDCFRDLTKAHCQVLVGYLDVKFPNWDADEKEGIWSYFFPAIAEKFPDLVAKEWRGKLKYPSGPRVSTELKRRTGPTKLPTLRSSPLSALLQGIGIGAAVLVIIVGGIFVIRQLKARSGRSEIKVVIADAPAGSQGGHLAASAQPAPAPDGPRPSITPTEGVQPLSDGGSGPVPPQTLPQTPDPQPFPPAQGAPAANPARTEAMAPAESSAPEAAPPGGRPTAMKDPGLESLFGPPDSPKEPKPPAASPARPASAPSAPGSLDALFGTPVSDAPSETAPPSGTLPGGSAPAAAARKTTVLLTKPVEVPVRFGTTKLPAGTQLKIVSQEGSILKVNYLGAVVAIPASSTDVASAAP